MVHWYFDFISPFSYLHLKQFGKLPADLEIEYVPVLFAGILKHYEHKGPAEIAPKRLYTYKQVVWLGKHLGIPFKVPPAHPFNSLHALRLVIAAGATRGNVETAFDMIWKDGLDMQDPTNITELGKRLHIKDVQAALSDEKVKATLKANTDGAIARGVFGVPTFLVGGCALLGPGFPGHDAGLPEGHRALRHAGDAPCRHAAGGHGAQGFAAIAANTRPGMAGPVGAMDG